MIPTAPPAERHPPPPHVADGLGALIGTLLVAAVVLGSLLWLIKPWRRRSNLPRARASWSAPPSSDDE